MADNTVMQSGRYKAYPDYKDSGISYLEYVPKDWIVVKFGYTNVKAELGGNYLAGEGEDGIVVMKMGNISRGFIDLSKLERIPLNERYDNKHLLAPGDFLFNTRNSMELVGKVATWKGELKEVIYNSNILRITFSKKFVDSSDFMSYLFNSDRVLSQLRLIAKGTTNVAAVYYKDLASLIVALPPLKEQSKIAKFLDYETAKIDTLIEKQQRLIELLTEKRQATISHAVTKGLNPDVPMKDSGVEWLGDVPAHWEVSKLKYYSGIQGGYAFSSQSFSEQGVPVLKIANVYQNRLALERQPTYVSEKMVDLLPEFVVQSNDILMSLTGTLGKRDYGFAVKVESEGKYLLNQRVAKLNPIDSKVNRDFLVNTLWSESYLNQLYSLPSGTKQANLSNSDVLNIWIAIPPTKVEQEEIANRLAQEKNIFDQLVLKAKQAIQLMQERRTALISAAITGKIDVRDWVKPE